MTRTRFTSGSPFLLTGALIAWVGAPGFPAISQEVDFNRDIQPILSDRCFHCHGPDASNQRSDFRLDTREHALADLGGYAGVVPGDLEASELHRRIRSDDPDDVMPPPDSNRVLSDREKDLLDAWIRGGAEFQKHWSLRVPVRPEPPAPSASAEGWVRNPIDHFVVARLEREGGAPSPQADRETLFRRAALSLTGLQPTPEEMDAFLGDSSPMAFERAVDRLLGTLHYAERMTQRWLDAARYADTDGYQNDNERSNWPWRDWVIGAFHENMPFDQFTVEQIAGDLLPGATTSQVLGSAFNRNHRQNSEGGVLAEEFFVENVIDRVETTGTVWLGLTIGCARCHDHKYDPVSQEDFYQLFAYFNNIGERGIGAGTSANPILNAKSPLLETPAFLERRIESARVALESAEASLPDRLAPWVARTAEALSSETDDWTGAPVAEAVSTRGRLTRQDDGSWKIRGNVSNPDYRIVLRPDSPRTVRALRIDALPDDAFGRPRGLAPSVNGNFVVTSVSVSVPSAAGADGGSAVDIPVARAVATFEQSGYPAANVLDDDDASGWAVFGADVQPEPVSLHLLLGESVTLAADAPLELRIHHGGGFDRHHIGRFRVWWTDIENPDTGGGADFPPVVTEAVRRPVSEWTDEQRRAVLEHFRGVDTEIAGARVALEKARKALVDYGIREVPVMVMREKDGDPTTAYFLNRGQYNEPDRNRPMSRGVPDALLPEGSAQPADRLELARWLVSRDNPLTARVIVNRIWQHHFGVGLVKTAEDFGLQGEPPSHPSLLDWLAVEFIESGWDLKGLHRLIVTSATFRQSSRSTPEQEARDPENRLLGRGPRFRMDGFAIRDMALRSAGLLESRVGGPPVKPYQPEGLWNAVNQNENFRYQRDRGADLYRKSLYTYWKRAVNPPRQLIFDAAGRETCSVRQRVTNTPLQALVLMNDETFVEAARHVAARVLHGDTAGDLDRLAGLYRIATARRAGPETLSVLADNLRFFREHFGVRPDQAERFLSVGASPADASLDPVEHAAFTAAAHLVLNLDETITLE